MNPPNKAMLAVLRRAVRTQRAAREALNDLQDTMSANEFSEQMLEVLQDEVINIDLYDQPVDMERLQSLVLAVTGVAL